MAEAKTYREKWQVARQEFLQDANRHAQENYLTVLEVLDSAVLSGSAADFERAIAGNPNSEQTMMDEKKVRGYEVLGYEKIQAQIEHNGKKKYETVGLVKFVDQNQADWVRRAECEVWQEFAKNPISVLAFAGKDKVNWFKVILGWIWKVIGWILFLPAVMTIFGLFLWWLLFGPRDDYLEKKKKKEQEEKDRYAILNYKLSNAYRETNEKIEAILEKTVAVRL